MDCKLAAVYRFAGEGGWERSRMTVVLSQVKLVAAKQEEFAERLAEWDRKLKEERSALRQWEKKRDADRRDFVKDHTDGAPAR